MVRAITMANTTFDIEAAAILGLKAQVGESFAQAVALALSIPGRVVVMGMGKSGHIGRKIAATLSSTGTPALFVHPAEASHGDLGMITPQDLVLMISNSGESDEINAIVPVLKRADELSLPGLTRGTNDLAARARSKKLSPADVQESTFTITNPGVFGSLFGTPIIPVGTTAILGLGAIEKRAKVVTGRDGEETIAIRTCAYFSLSFDHRVIDGADADRFMADLKKTLETIPDTGF